MSGDRKSVDELIDSHIDGPTLPAANLQWFQATWVQQYGNEQRGAKSGRCEILASDDESAREIMVNDILIDASMQGWKITELEIVLKGSFEDYKNAMAADVETHCPRTDSLIP